MVSQPLQGKWDTSWLRVHLNESCITGTGQMNLTSCKRTSTVVMQQIAAKKTTNRNVLKCI